MLQIEEQDMNKLLFVRNKEQCVWHDKKRTRKYDDWATALEIKVRLNTNSVMLFYSFISNDTLRPVQGWEDDFCPKDLTMQPNGPREE